MTTDKQILELCDDEHIPNWETVLTLIKLTSEDIHLKFGI